MPANLRTTPQRKTISEKGKAISELKELMASTENRMEKLTVPADGAYWVGCFACFHIFFGFTRSRIVFLRNSMGTRNTQIQTMVLQIDYGWWWMMTDDDDDGWGWWWLLFFFFLLLLYMIFLFYIFITIIIIVIIVLIFADCGNAIGTWWPRQALTSELSSKKSQLTEDLEEKKGIEAGDVASLWGWNGWINIER